MASTSTVLGATPSTVPASSTPTASLSVRHRLRAFVLVVFLGFLLLSAATYAYLWHGWFESAQLGQTLLIRRIYEAGPNYRARGAFGIFPRAHGLLHEPFAHNEWKITSSDGYTLYHQESTWWAVPLSQIPQQVRAVFLFREDRRFYQHTGVDPRALLRALGKTLTGHKQGASTIAMQVAKHCLLDYGDKPATTGLRVVL
jgi:Transglycosylase